MHDRRSFFTYALPSLALGIPMTARPSLRRTAVGDMLRSKAGNRPEDPGSPRLRAGEVQELIRQAVADDRSCVVVPSTLLPYDATNLNFHPDVQMLRESNITDQYDIRAYGASGDGVADDTCACQTAIDHAGRQGGIIRFPAGTYRVAGLDVPSGVNLLGDGPSVTTIDGVGDRSTLTGVEKLQDQSMAGFTIQHANSSASGVDLLDLRCGALWCCFQQLVFVGKRGVTRSGFHLRGENPDTGRPNSNQFNNLVMMCRSRSYGRQVRDGRGIWLEGVDDLDKRCNLNKVIGGSWDGFGRSIALEAGNANYFCDLNINSADIAAFDVRGDRETFNNFIFGCFVDAKVEGTPLRIESRDDSPHTLVQVFGSSRIEVPSDVHAVNARSKYSIFSRSVFIGNSMSDRLATDRSQVLAGADRGGILRTMGGPTFQSGGFVASGSEFRRGIRAVSDEGGASAVLRETGEAKTSFRIVTTPDGERFAVRFKVSEDGGVEITDILNFTGEMGSSGQDPRDDEPDKWVEVAIDGEPYYVPAYRA